MPIKARFLEKKKGSNTKHRFCEDGQILTSADNLTINRVRTSSQKLLFLNFFEVLTYGASKLVALIYLFPVFVLPPEAEEEEPHDHQGDEEQDTQGHTESDHVG